jgi:prepilin-type N-terminal cleavage/methylation domain-containing protein
MQRILSRRGFTMIELLVALVLLGLVSTALYRVLVNNQRLYMAQTQRIDLSQNIRAAASILPAEFRELSASEGDITTNPLSPTRLDIRGMRWLSFICTPPVLGGALVGGVLNNVFMVVRGGSVLGQPMYFGARTILLSDSMLVYYDGNQTTRADDFWAVARPTALQAQNCPDGRPGTRVTMNVNLAPVGVAGNVNGAITVGAPVRGYERVIYQLYQPAGDTSWYIGMQPAAGVMQPLVGPVLANGFTMSYFDSTGVVTNNRVRIARIDITVRARTAAPVRSGGQAPLRAIVDSVTTSVALRNNRRF